MVEKKQNIKVKKLATFHLRESTLLTLARAKYWDREDSQSAIIEKALAKYWEGRNYLKTPKE